MMLAGGGFRLTASEARHLAALDGTDTQIRPYVGGSELMQGQLGRLVIDLFGLSEKEARINSLQRMIGFCRL